MEESVLEMGDPGSGFCWVLELPAGTWQVMCCSAPYHMWMLMYPFPS